MLMLVVRMQNAQSVRIVATRPNLLRLGADEYDFTTVELPCERGSVSGEYSLRL
jgi:hypothetical protein